MSEITLIGIDLAKNMFRLNSVDKKGKRTMNRNIPRDGLLRFLSTLPQCTVAMEACASSHYWGRSIAALGHTVKLIHPQYVTPYRLGDKNDANDAAAICAAALRPDMRFVRLRSKRQTDIQSLHRVRSGLVQEKTATINRVRALLAENGIVIKQGASAAYAMLPVILDDVDNDLSTIMRRTLRSQYDHMLHLREQVKELESTLKSLVAEDNDCQRLMEIPGVGLLTATMLASEIGNGSPFKRGRSFAAYVGLVPRQHSSGGKNILLGISKRGKQYLRTLLTHCARAALRTIVLGKAPFGGTIERWVLQVMERRGKHKAIVALAAKLARIACCIMSKGTNFRSEARAC